jgi:rhamnogalacturonan endolyase
MIPSPVSPPRRISFAGRSPRSLLGAIGFAIGAATAWAANSPGVSLLVNGAPAMPGEMKPADVHSLVVSNGLLSITFGQDSVGDFSVTSVVKNGTELAHNLHGIEPRDVDRGRTFYLDYGAGRGHLQADTVQIVRASPALAHFAVIDRHNPVQLAHHFVMLPGESGIYDYVIIKTAAGGRGGGGEMRTMYRFDRDILDWAWNVERTGQQPKYADLVKLPNLQDETWRLPDGTVYQKYDYCAYYSESPMWGHYGHGFGVWFMPVSTESYAGGPLREELIVHQDALILNYIGGGHFGGGGTAAGLKGEKLHGPWFLYFNTGATPDALIADARQQAAAEQAKWPYAWMDEPLYPQARTRVTGQLQVADGRSAAGAWVVLGQPGGDVYRMSGDYIFYTRADAGGRFTLPHVRPGRYTLYAWATRGSIARQLERADIDVKGGALDLGLVEWKPPHRTQLLWQIGQSDRMAGEFKFGRERRNIQWIGQVPATLTYTIGQSREADDWYFAQGKVGHWDVNFDLDRVFEGNAVLTVALAGGGACTVKILVNGQEVKTLAPNNDASTYRSALRSARYLLEEITFPANRLKRGANTVQFNLTNAGGRNNGLMYDTVILEVE